MAKETPEELIARLDKERAERIKLTDRGGWPDRDRISFDEAGENYWIEIPPGLDLANKLRCIDLFLSGIAQGRDEGRFTLQGEFLDLIGAARRE